VSKKKIGYCIALETREIIHYSYPFYQLTANSYQLPPNLGLGMMLGAILYAKEHNKKHIYLGSFQRPSDVYKLQFKGLEWWDGEMWQTDLDDLKKI
jgi:arginyl-tRNA--protein-N-Asp/Glu arginylyltransferase